MGLTPTRILEHRLTQLNGAVRPARMPSGSHVDLNIPLEGHNDAFDAIVAVGVIEHLEKPRMMIREMWRTLIPVRRIILTTSNNESLPSGAALFSRSYYVACSDSCYPARTAALLPKDFPRIFGESGFLVLEFHLTNDSGIPGEPSMSFGLLRGVRFSDNIVAVTEKAVPVTLASLQY